MEEKPKYYYINVRWVILIGIVLFFLRYLPLYPLPLGSGRISLDQASGACGGVLGGFVGLCAWVRPLNMAVIVIAVGLVGYGIFKLVIANQNKKVGG